MILPPVTHLSVLRSIGPTPAIERLDWAHARVLKATDAGSVLRLEVADEPSTQYAHLAPVLIAKTMRLDTLGDRAKAALRASRLDRQWRGSKRLAGIAETPPLIALIRGRRARQRLLTLLMAHVPGPTLLEQLARSAADDLAEPAGRLLGRLTRCGLFNRDPKPSNLIVSPGQHACPDGPNRIVMVDTVAIRRTRHPLRTLPRMLAALVLEPTGAGCPPSRDWLVRAASAAGSEAGLGWGADRLVERVDTLVARHGDPTPVDNPLHLRD